MHDWIFEARAELLMLTLPDQPWSSDQGATSWFSPEPADDFETWLPGPESKGDLGDFGLLFSANAAELDEVIVQGRRVEGFPTAVQVGFDDGSGAGDWSGGETGGGGDPTPPDDECPWGEFYEDVARQVGLLAGALGAIKDSWITFDPRDDRAIERALVGIDGLEIMLQSQTISYATAHDTISSLLDLMLSEGTDHLAAVFGAAAGGFVTGLFDGPIPAGEVLGGIGGAVAVYLAGDRLPTAELADVIATLVLAGIDVPPGTPGRRCGGD